MPVVHTPATRAATPATSFAAEAVNKVGLLGKELANVSKEFDFGEAFAAATYVVLSFYGIALLAYAALRY